MMDPGGKGAGDGTGSDSTSRASGPGTSGTDRSSLESLRERIVQVDELLVELVAERKALVLQVGEVKRRLGLPVLDPSREASVVRRAAEMAREKGLDEELTRDVIWRIMAAAREEQEKG